MNLDLPDPLVEKFRIVDAAFSGRSIAGEKSMQNVRKTIEEAHRILFEASDEVATLIVREIAKKRG